MSDQVTKKDDLIRLLKNDDLVMSSCRENNGIVVDRNVKRRKVNDVSSEVVRTTDKVVMQLMMMMMMILRLVRQLDPQSLKVIER